ncbi:hypothetical protein J6590_070053 [Homalodisca vitripennis]|nr:hypothetical protein J6590_070053 [Homalodisca vitripennis]
MSKAKRVINQKGKSNLPNYQAVRHKEVPRRPGNWITQKEDGEWLVDNAAIRGFSR